MKKFKVLLTRDYLVDIRAENKEQAKLFAEYFVAGGIDASTENERMQYKFEIERIKPTVNDAFEVEEIQN